MSTDNTRCARLRGLGECSAEAVHCICCQNHRGHAASGTMSSFSPCFSLPRPFTVACRYSRSDVWLNSRISIRTHNELCALLRSVDASNLGSKQFLGDSHNSRADRDKTPSIDLNVSYIHLSAKGRLSRAATSAGQTLQKLQLSTEQLI